MVPVSTTADFLLADARAALRRRASEDGRTELSRAFAKWLLHETNTDAEFASLVNEAATREGAQQDFHTVAILGFGADAGILEAEQIDALKKGLRRQAGRGVVIDELPAAFCSDAVGILGVVVGTKAVADTELTDRVMQWASKFLKKSYDGARTEEWERCLFAVADFQLGNTLSLSVPKSLASADVRTALAARGAMEDCDKNALEQDRQQTVNLAMHEPQNDLPHDRASLRLAALEHVILTATPAVGVGTTVLRQARRRLSERDARVHAAIGKDSFRSRTNADIMKESSVKKLLRAERLEAGSDAAKNCLDRIRRAEGYPLSREIAEKRSNAE
jgi:hypothetical protein